MLSLLKKNSFPLQIPLQTLKPFNYKPLKNGFPVVCFGTYSIRILTSIKGDKYRDLYGPIFPL